MTKKTNSNKIISNLIWRFAERSGAQLVTFVVSVILARMLEPSVYGVIALVTVFTSILQVFIDSGLGNSLVQKKDADDLDFSTVFFANIAFCLILYSLLYLFAPYIAKFYGMPELTKIVRVMGLSLIISGVKNIQQAYVSKYMMFKCFFYSTLIGTVGAAFLGIFMAYKGMGVWALVIQGLFNSFVDSCVLWVTIKWRPKWCFSWSRLKGLYAFGWKLLVAILVDTVYRDIRQLIIGKLYTADSLALYNKGAQLPKVIVTNVNSSIDSVLFPAMAEAQEKKEKVKNMTRMAVRTSSYVMWPLLIGLAAVGEPFVTLLLTEKWLGCVPFLRIFCITNAFLPIHTANLNAIKAVGRSDLLLKLEIIKKVLGLVILLIAMPYGVFAICFSVLIYNAIVLLINTIPNQKILGYSFFAQMKDILPSATLSLVMSIVVWSIGFFKMPVIITLIVQVITGMLVYIIFSVLFKIDTFKQVLDIIKSFIGKAEKVSS